MAEVLTYNAHQAAGLVGVSDETMLKWVAEGRVLAERKGRQWAISAVSLGLLPLGTVAAFHQVQRTPPAGPVDAIARVQGLQAIAEAALRVHAAQLIAGDCGCPLCDALRAYVRQH